jgi:hypothetical protein
MTAVIGHMKNPPWWNISAMPLIQKPPWCVSFTFRRGRIQLDPAGWTREF